MLLQGQSICKSFGKGDALTHVLKGVDMNLEAGEFVAIMGKSGCGKSTLLNILSTLDQTDKGQVFFEGKDISQLSDEEAAKLRLESFGFVFQMPRMVKNLTILDNILLPSLTYKKDKEAAKQQALALMNEIGISDLADKRISQVSGGQLQRAGICRALINNPNLIFADEPTGALDSKSGHEVMKLFSQYHQAGKSILMVTHDMALAAKAQRVLLMKDGLIQEDLTMGTSEKDNLFLLQNHMSNL
ncbi:ABC transporter ATP-binding protein [Streptococcus sp.]|uniref:ABC transporter ATP-binding protein n=1 Tax=Streptococcus sp. TaxID=1306 RepID=UPI0035A0EE64